MAPGASLSSHNTLILQQFLITVITVGALRRRLKLITFPHSEGTVLLNPSTLRRPRCPGSAGAWCRPCGAHGDPPATRGASKMRNWWETELLAGTPLLLCLRHPPHEKHMENAEEAMLIAALPSSALFPCKTSQKRLEAAPCLEQLSLGLEVKLHFTLPCLHQLFCLFRSMK